MLFVVYQCRRNANYAGPATLDSIAQQIANAHGPSGPNWEYVCKLAEAFRQVRCARGHARARVCVCFTEWRRMCVSYMGMQTACVMLTFLSRVCVFSVHMLALPCPSSGNDASANSVCVSVCAQMSLEDPELFELEAKVLALKRSEQQQQSSVLAASTLTS